MTVELELMWQRRRGLENVLDLGHSMYRGLEVGGNGIQEPKGEECEGGTEAGRVDPQMQLCGTLPLESERVMKGIKQEYDMVRFAF